MVADTNPSTGSPLTWFAEPSLGLFREIYLACKARPELVPEAVKVLERWPAQVASQVRAAPVSPPLDLLFDAVFRATGHAVATSSRAGRPGLSRRVQHEVVIAALGVVERTREIERVFRQGAVVTVDRDVYPAGVFLPSRLRHERGNEHRSLHHFPGFQLRSRRTRNRADADDVARSLCHDGPRQRPDWPSRYTWHFESAQACLAPTDWYVFDRVAARTRRGAYPDYLEELLADLPEVLTARDTASLTDPLRRFRDVCDEVARDHMRRTHADADADMIAGFGALVFTRVWKLATLRGAVHPQRGTELRDAILKDLLGCPRYNPLDALFREMDARLDRRQADAAVPPLLAEWRDVFVSVAQSVVRALDELGVRTTTPELLAFAHKQFGRNRNRPLYLAHNELALPIPDPSGRRDATGAVTVRRGGWMRREVIGAFEVCWEGAVPDDGLALLWTQIMAGYRGRVRGRRVRHFQTRLGAWPDITTFARMRETLSVGLLDLARVLEQARLEVVARRTTVTPPRLESLDGFAERGRRDVELRLAQASSGAAVVETGWAGDTAGWLEDAFLRSLTGALGLERGVFAPHPGVPAGGLCLLLAELLGPSQRAPEGGEATLAAIRLRLGATPRAMDLDEAQFQVARLAALHGAGGVRLSAADLANLDAVVRAWCAVALRVEDVDDELADALWLSLLDLGGAPEAELVEERRRWPELLERLATIGDKIRAAALDAQALLEGRFGHTLEGS